MPRAVIFGYDGVLVDQSGLRQEVLQQVLAEEGIPASPESFASNPPRAPYERWLAEILDERRERSGPARAARLMARARTLYRAQLLAAGPRWLAGAPELVERLTAGGRPAALVAAAPADEVERALEAKKLAGAIKVVVAEAELIEPASQRSGHALALALLNSQPPLPERLIHPHEVVAIEASPAAARAASEAGQVVVRIGTSTGEERFADYRAASVAEIDPTWLAAG